MNEDTIYVLTLIISIALGYLFQNINNIPSRKWFATIAGFLVTLFVSRIHVLHALLLTFLMGTIVKHVSSRCCHVVSFLTGFSYLVFFRMTEYFGIPSPTGHANMIQMILTLKLIGLAFEVHDSSLLNKKLKDEAVQVTDQELYRKITNLTIMDVFHYSFCYAGVLTGPYFTYRSYCDMFQYPINKCNLCFKETIKTMTYIPLFAVMYLMALWAFPIQALYSREFFTKTTFLYRLWYMYPTFFIFRMRMYIAFKLSEAVCMAAGLGLYPVNTKPKLGSGPSTNFYKLDVSKQESDEVYSFETIRSINIFQCEFSYTVKEAVRHWNRSIQYWLAAYVYHRFPYKRYRTLVTFFISSLWHGIYAGYYFSLFSVPLYLLIEDVFQKRVIKNDTSKLKNFILWNAKMFQFSYWGLAFQVKNYSDVWNYGMSIYFMPYIIAVGMYTVAMLMYK